MPAEVLINTSAGILNNSLSPVTGKALAKDEISLLSNTPIVV